MTTKLIRDGRATRLIRWARAFDIKMKTIQAKRDADNSVYFRTLRKERVDLHDEDATNLMNMSFMDWSCNRKPRVPVIDID